MSDSIADLVRQRLNLHADLPGPTERQEIRRGAGLSQSELARIVGVSTAAIGHWETGRRSIPRGPLLERYVEALRALCEATNPPAT